MDSEHPLSRKLQEVIAEDCGGMLLSVVAAYAYVDADGEQVWGFLVGDANTLSASLGLASALKRAVERDVDSSLDRLGNVG